MRAARSRGDPTQLSADRRPAKFGLWSLGAGEADQSPTSNPHPAGFDALMLNTLAATTVTLNTLAATTVTLNTLAATTVTRLLQHAHVLLTHGTAPTARARDRGKGPG